MPARLCDSLLGQAPSPSIPRDHVVTPFHEMLRVLLSGKADTKTDVTVEVREEGTMYACLVKTRE